MRSTGALLAIGVAAGTSAAGALHPGGEPGGTFKPENGGMSEEPTTIQVTVVGPHAVDVSRQVRDALLAAGFVLGENGTFQRASEITISCTSSPLLQRVSQN